MTENQRSIISDLTMGMMLAMVVYMFNSSREISIIHLLSDCFFVPAIVLLGFGGIRFCTSRGALDMMGYGFKTVGEMFTKAGRLDGPDEDYFEYCQRKAAERKPFGHYLVSGGIFLLLSIILTAAYYLIGS